MAKTLKQILDDVLLETGFQVYPAYATSNKVEPRQLLALANRELNKLQKDEWQALKLTFTLDMTSATEYDFPADYRQFIPDTAWATDQERKADFPVNNETWAYLKARDVATGLTYRVRLAGDKIQIHNPRDGEQLYVEYITKNAVQVNGGGTKERFDKDDDEFLLNDDLLIMGVKWRFAKAKGLPYETDYADYKSAYRAERATDKNAQTLEFAAPEQFPPFPPQTDLYLRP